MSFLSPNQDNLLNQSYLNLKLANQSFIPHQVSRPEKNKPNNSSTLFSWERTWNSSSANDTNEHLKSLYFKGKMYAIAPSPKQPARVLDTAKPLQSNKLDYALILAGTFSVSSFFIFVTAILVRCGAI